MQVAAEGKTGGTADRTGKRQDRQEEGQQTGQAEKRTGKRQDRQETGQESPQLQLDLSSKFKFKENTRIGNYTCQKSWIWSLKKAGLL